jgi:hypothetical protein
VAGRTGGVVDCPRFIAGFDLAAHHAVADQNRQVVYRGVLGKRKGVDGFDLVLERIFELLRHDNAI